MKKILYGCVALSVLITVIAIVELNKKPAPVASPDETPAAPVAGAGTPTETPTFEGKMYTESEDKIQEAFENYLYFKGMDQVIRTDVRADGKDFVITITNPSDSTVPPQELRLTRVDDFAGKPQYKLGSTSLVKWKAVAENYLNDPKLSADTFSEDISWVPDLGLVTNQSLKATNVSVAEEGINLTVKSIVSDMLSTAENDKMNVAGSSDITDMKIVMPNGVIQAPTVTQNMQINGANQTGNILLQLLTAESATSTLNIPILGIGMTALPGQPILAQLNNKIVFADNISMDMTLSNIKVGKMLLPMLPDTITSNMTVEGVSKEMLIAYMNMRDQLNQLPDEEGTEAKDLEQKLLSAQNQILKSLSLKINKLSLTNPNAGIDVTGIVHYAEPAPTVNARVSVTNFDVISPKAPPVDEAACKAALAQTPAPVAGQAPIIPAACAQQSGVLEGLRPFLETAEHTINEKGQPVDTFSIVYSANSLSINNQPILAPNTETADPSNLPLGTDMLGTPTVQSAAPMANTENVSETSVLPAVLVEPNMAPAPLSDEASLGDIPVPTDNMPSVADLMAEEVDETVAVAPVAASQTAEQADVAQEMVPTPQAVANEAPVDVAPDNMPTIQDDMNAANASDVILENIDSSLTEEVADTPLEPTPMANTNDTLSAPAIEPLSAPIDIDAAAVAPLPTAPLVDPTKIVEAQKLLDATE